MVEHFKNNNQITEFNIEDAYGVPSSERRLGPKVKWVILSNQKYHHQKYQRQIDESSNRKRTKTSAVYGYFNNEEKFVEKSG